MWRLDWAVRWAYLVFASYIDHPHGLLSAEDLERPMLSLRSARQPSVHGWEMTTNEP